MQSLVLFINWIAPFILSELRISVNSNSLIYSFIDAHLAVYLIWRRDTTAKGAKKEYIAKCYTFTAGFNYQLFVDTSPNINYFAHFGKWKIMTPYDLWIGIFIVPHLLWHGTFISFSASLVCYPHGLICFGFLWKKVNEILNYVTYVFII